MWVNEPVRLTLTYPAIMIPPGIAWFQRIFVPGAGV